MAKNHFLIKDVKNLNESKKSAKKSLTEGLRYDSITLELIQDDIELYFENKGYDVKIIESGMAKGLTMSYIYICKGKDFNKIKSDDLYDFLYSDVINGMLYYNHDFNVVVKNKQIMIILPKTRDYTESKKSTKKSLKERDDTIFSKDVKHWMLSGKNINITFKDGNELVGAIYEHRKDSEDKKAECFLCEDLTADYTGNYFIVEVYNGKISEIKFQSYDWLEHYMDDSYDLMESKKSIKNSLKEKVTVSKSLKIIERALLDLIHNDTIQEEFNMAFDDVNGIYDSVDDMFEVSVHNVLNKLLKEHTITVLPF